MQKVTSLFAIATLAIFLPACAKKVKKQEVTTEQVHPEPVATKVEKNNKEDFAL